MPKGSNPSLIVNRLYVESERLQKWAARHGSDQQKTTARKLVELHIHINHIFAPGAQVAEAPTKSKHSQAVIDAINLGAAAFAAGVVHTDNPYEIGDQRNVAWNGGWNRAWYDAQHPAVNSVE